MTSVGWRSTTLRLAEQHCPRALDYYEQGVPYERDRFSVGVAAHAVLEEVGKAAAAAERYLTEEESEAIGRSLCEKLIAEGRDFEGDREPPLTSDAVWLGFEMALSYIGSRPMPPHFAYEEGLAVNRDWRPCPYDDGAWLRARIDYRGTVHRQWYEDDDIGVALEVGDFKSAWSADEGELRSIQRKIQAVLAWDRWGAGHDRLRLVVVNFRLQREYDLVVFPNEPQGADVLARWRREIESEIRARETGREADGRRPAAPGAGCMECPYLFRCDAARDHLEGVYGSREPEDLAQRYAVSLAAVEALKKPLREAAAEQPIPIPGGLVGTFAEQQRCLRGDAPERLAELWLKRARPETMEMATAQLPGLFKALRLGVAQVEALLTHIWKGGEEEVDRRRRHLESLCSTKIVRKFGVERTTENPCE